MKRASKPPTPPSSSARDDALRSPRNLGAAQGTPPPLPSASRKVAPFVGSPPRAPRGPLVPEGPDPITEDVSGDDLETQRPPAPTIPFVPTPGVEWPTSPAGERRPPSSHNIPTAPKRPPSDRSMEAALREQMWTGLQPGAAQPGFSHPGPAGLSHPGPAQTPHTAQTGPHLPVQLQRGFAPAPAPAPLRSSPTTTASGTYSTISEQRDGSVPRSDRTPGSPTDPGWPLGYIVASAFFLAIAVVGFGLWLAFEVF